MSDGAFGEVSGGVSGEAYDLDSMALRCRELLRESAGDLLAEACAWSVGLSDHPHYRRRHGRVVPTGMTLGECAEAGQPLAGEEDATMELGEAEPGTFRDALNSLTADGGVHLTRLENEVLAPFVTDICVRAAARLREDDPAGWQELLAETGEDGGNLRSLVRIAEWELPLRLDAEVLVVAAIGDSPLVAVEAEGLPLSLVRAAEALTRDAAEPELEAGPRPADDDLAGALFLAEVALRQTGLDVPVPPDAAGILLGALVEQGLEHAEVLRVLPHLPVQQGTASHVAELLARRDGT